MPGSRYVVTPPLRSSPPGERPGLRIHQRSFCAPPCPRTQVAAVVSLGAFPPVAPGHALGIVDGLGMTAPVVLLTSFIAAARAGLTGAARFRSGSGSGNEFSAWVQVMVPTPWSWISPALRQTASGAVTFRTPPPVRLSPMPVSARLQPEPLELDWTLPAEVTFPVPEIRMALH